MDDTRICIVCGKVKGISQFRGKKRGKTCKECSSNRVKKWQSENRDKLIENNRRYRERNGEPAREIVQQGFKKCSRCGEVLAVDNFWENVIYCKPCASAISKEYRLKERKLGIPSRQHKQNISKSYDKQREKRKDFLGMEHGAATHRLRVMVIFALAVQCGRDVCFRCGKKIANASEISIDHKIDWEGVSPDLFWDVNNVAFSHRKCNTNRKVREFNARLQESFVRVDDLGLPSKYPLVANLSVLIYAWVVRSALSTGDKDADHCG